MLIKKICEFFQLIKKNIKILIKFCCGEFFRNSPRVENYKNQRFRMFNIFKKNIHVDMIYFYNIFTENLMW